MTDYNRPDSSNIDGFTAAGVPVVSQKQMLGGSLTGMGCTLVLGTTYYFPFGAQHSATPAETPVVTAQVRWDAAAILTITVETTVFPSSFQALDPRTPPVQVSDFDATAGFWLQQNPTTAYVPATGGTPTNMTVAVAGGTAGGCEFDISNLGSRRARIKIVVGGTGGVVRVGIHGKAAG